MSLTREEILDLSKLTEAEQEGQLEKAGILESYVCCSCGTNLPESLADCANRLWKEAKITNIYTMRDVYETIIDCDWVWNDHDYINFYRWWAMDALPIHRIQAALLAKEFQNEVG